MSYSLNEIDALCRKAARGAGHGWGHAEDAGKAARWLEARGIAGASCLLDCLEATDGAQSAVTVSGSDWRDNGPLCPIFAGACLSDHAAALAGRPVTLHDVRYPVLLAPFAAAVAAQTHRAVALNWPGVDLALHDGSSFDAPPDRLLVDRAETVTCTLTDAPDRAATGSQSRVTLPPDIRDRLNALAQRTYAPATEASRAAGAGAGLTDND